MEAFTSYTGVAVPLKASDVDTDQIMPGKYLKRVSRFGYEDGLFGSWRAEPDFVLNQEPFRSGTVLVAGTNFGTGSSREHAVWGLQQYGFKAVISSSFADIFCGNAGKGGLVTAQVDHVVVEQIWAHIDEVPGVTVTVDLPSRTITCNNEAYPFHIDDYVAWRIENGLDDISLTLKHLDDIQDFERRRPSWKPSVTTAVQ